MKRTEAGITVLQKPHIAFEVDPPIPIQFRSHLLSSLLFPSIPPEPISVSYMGASSCPQPHVYKQASYLFGWSENTQKGTGHHSFFVFL